MYSNKLDATTRDATNDEWDTIWANCSYANYYQSREWAEVWSKYKGGITKPAPVLIYFSDDKKIILPFSKENIIKKGMFYRYVTSVPSGRPGGGYHRIFLICRMRILFIILCGIIMQMLDGT